MSFCKLWMLRELAFYAAVYDLMRAVERCNVTQHALSQMVNKIELDVDLWLAYRDRLQLLQFDFRFKRDFFPLVDFSALVHPHLNLPTAHNLDVLVSEKLLGIGHRQNADEKI